MKTRKGLIRVSERLQMHLQGTKNDISIDPNSSQVTQIFKIFSYIFFLPFISNFLQKMYLLK